VRKSGVPAFAAWTIRRLWAAVKIDVKKLAERLALDRRISDYDFWRAQKSVEDALYRTERLHQPIPIDLVYAREILRKARRRRDVG
jgi:hypothetical protein